MIRSLKIAVLLGGMLLPALSFSQKDFNLWTGLDLRYKVNKDLDFGLEIQSRFESNVSTIEQTFLSPYVRYDVHKYIQLGMDYRLSNRPETGIFGERNVHRVTLDAEFNDLFRSMDALKRFQFDTRLRFTHATRGAGELNNDNLRLRAKLSYNLPKTKLTPHIATEFFYHFNDQLVYLPTEVKSVHRFSKYRLRAGLSYPMKQHKISAIYVVEPEIEGPATDYILSVGYSYTFKK